MEKLIQNIASIPTSPPWLKSKGYLHITPNIDVNRDSNKLISKITNKKFIANYAFYPLIHTVIKERKYKKADLKKDVTKNGNLRAHKFKNLKTGETKRTAKSRPLHYATHLDAIIYAYYAFLLQDKYENELKKTTGLNDCITAYRKLKINPALEDNVKGNGKSTIHFAKEVFEEISRRSQTENISVLAFDIKSFFSSLDHQKLKKVWEEIMGFESINDHKDHANVFKATTLFNYVLLDSFRIAKGKGKKQGFNEKRLSEIRRKNGFKSFFESNVDFRKSIKSGELKVYSNPFKKKGNVVMGIPQGLPISAILANMYLLDFDKAIVNNLVNNRKCYYRRYSDDIILICNSDDVPFVQKTVEEEMENAKVDISKEKTEKFDFRLKNYNKLEQKRLTSFKYNLETGKKVHAPLVYLGFEYRGYNTLVKSANISKFYRRMINIIKRRARRAEKNMLNNPDAKNVIYINQIKKLYKLKPKDKDNNKGDKNLGKPRSFLKRKANGEFYFSKSKSNSPKKRNSNYFSYINRAATIIDNNGIKKQLRKSKHILWSSINKYLKKEI